MKHEPHRFVPRTGNKRYVNLTLTAAELAMVRRALDVFGDHIHIDCYESRAMNSLWEQVVGAEARHVEGRASVTRADVFARLNARSVSRVEADAGG